MNLLLLTVDSLTSQEAGDVFEGFEGFFLKLIFEADRHENAASLGPFPLHHHLIKLSLERTYNVLLYYDAFQFVLALGPQIQVHPAAHVEIGVFPHLTSALSTPTHVQPACLLGIYSPRLRREHAAVLPVLNQDPTNLELRDFEPRSCLLLKTGYLGNLSQPCVRFG